MAMETAGGPPWLVEARKLVGLREIVGSRHEARILQFFAEAGHPGIHDDETAWCAAFVGAMLRRAGYSSSGALNARSYLNFGTKLEKPTLGCIVVFKRGSSSWQGHVAFFLRDLGAYIEVLGGNQGNAVSIARYRKADLLGYRWPLITSAPAVKPKPANDASPKAPAKLPVAPAVPADKRDVNEAAGAGGLVAIITGWLYYLWGSWAFRITIAMLILAALYWLIVRPILRRYWALEDVECDLLTRLRLALKGIKTRLFSALLGIAGVALPVLSVMTDTDLSAFLPDIFGIPAAFYQWALLAGIGWITNRLRQATTTPVGQTDLALAPTVVAPPLVPDTPPKAEPEVLVPEIVQEIAAKVAKKRQRKKKVRT